MVLYDHFMVLIRGRSHTKFPRQLMESTTNSRRSWAMYVKINIRTIFKIIDTILYNLDQRFEEIQRF